MYVPPQMAWFGVNRFMLEVLHQAKGVPMMGESLVFDERGYYECLAFGWMKMPKVTESPLYLQPVITEAGEEAKRIYKDSLRRLVKW